MRLLVLSDNRSLWSRLRQRVASTHAPFRAATGGSGFLVFVSIPLLFVTVLGADQKIGKPLTIAEPVPLTDLVANPGRFVDKTVQVRGRVTEVCEMMGCWMNLVDPSGERSIRVKVNDGELVFPKNSIGKIAIAEGKLTKLVLSREQAVARAKHEAEEQGRAFDPASVKSGATIYQIQGAGAVIKE